MTKLDQETKRITDVGSAVHDIVRGEAWGVVRRILTDRIVDLQWIGNIQGDPMLYFI